MPRSVILRHDVPGHRDHLDWMVEDPSVTGDYRLRTWRTQARPDRVDAFQATRIGDHRTRYLRFEGDIGGGRGSVRRIATGTVERCQITDDHARFEIRWENAPPTTYLGTPDGPGDAWTFTRIPGGHSTA